MDEKQANELIEEFVFAGVGLARELEGQKINHSIILTDKETSENSAGKLSLCACTWRPTMTDHKFEPFEKVLVRQTGASRWRARFYEAQYADHDGQHTRYETTDNGYWWECIPYTQETAHLLGPSQPYEPPSRPLSMRGGRRWRCMRMASGMRPYIYINQTILTITGAHEKTKH